MLVEYFQYQHPEYEQGRNPFESNTSVTDLLFNEGPAILDIIRSGVVKNQSSMRIYFLLLTPLAHVRRLEIHRVAAMWCVICGMRKIRPGQTHKP